MPDRIEPYGYLFKMSRYRGWEAAIQLQGLAPDGSAKADKLTVEKAAALKCLLDHQAQTAGIAFKATSQHIKELANENRDWYDFFNVSESEHDVLEMVGVPSIEVHDQSVEGFAWITPLRGETYEC